MLVSIDAIQVSADRRTASPEQVKALSESISDIGLLNPTPAGGREVSRLDGDRVQRLHAGGTSR